MAGTFYTGRTGKLKVDGRIVAKIRDWSIETTVELISTNTVDSRFNSFVPGVAGATGSATVMYYKEDGATPQDFTNFIGHIMKTDTNGVSTDDFIDFELRVDNTPSDTTNKDIIKCQGYITSMGIQVSTGEVSTIPISFTVSEDENGKLFTQVPSSD